MKQIIIGIVIFIVVTLVTYSYLTSEEIGTVYYDGYSDEEPIQSLEIDKSSLGVSMKTLMEYAYFEGQKDYINGEIKVEESDDGNFIWVDSPWDSGEEPIYKPKNNNDE